MHWQYAAQQRHQTSQRGNHPNAVKKRRHPSNYDIRRIKEETISALKRWNNIPTD